MHILTRSCFLFLLANDSIDVEQQISSTAHAPSHLSDWSVPPTSELSPRSLTSSSPDLTQQILPTDESLVHSDSNVYFRSIHRRYRSLSPNSLSDLERTTDRMTKSKSLTRLSNPFNESKRLGKSSPVLTLSSSQRIQKRRRDNEQRAKSKLFKMDFDDQLIIQSLLNDIIE